MPGSRPTFALCELQPCASPGRRRVPAHQRGVQRVEQHLLLRGLRRRGRGQRHRHHARRAAGRLHGPDPARAVRPRAGWRAVLACGPVKACSGHAQHLWPSCSCQEGPRAWFITELANTSCSLSSEYPTPPYAALLENNCHLRAQPPCQHYARLSEPPVACLGWSQPCSAARALGRTSRAAARCAAARRGAQARRAQRCSAPPARRPLRASPPWPRPAGQRQPMPLGFFSSLSKFSTS